MRSWNLAILLSCMMVRNAAAVIVDDFESGQLSQGPQTTLLELLQTDLPTSSVIGGEREWFALYDGSLDVDAQSSGELSLNHNRGIFEVAILKYGALVDSSPGASLNADFTAGGHRQITLRINRSQAAGAGPEAFPAFIQLNVRSGVGSPNALGASLAVRPIVSDEAYVLQAPFSSFSGFGGPVDFTDIDAVGVSFFVDDFTSLAIDEIVTSAGLPGDYNADGVVGAADYTVWQDHQGQPVSLPNEDPAAQTPGVVDDEDFNFWKSRFGNIFPPARDAFDGGVAVPEASLTQLLLASVVSIALRRR